jgi:large subunit ribosomal protein L7/L12
MSYDIVLHETGPRPIQVIKLVRQHTFPRLGLKEAKDLVESTPTLFRANVGRYEAACIRDALHAVGATVELVNRHERHANEKRRLKRHLLLRRQ